MRGLGAIRPPRPVWQYLDVGVKFDSANRKDYILVQVDDIDVRARLLQIDDDTETEADRQRALDALKADVRNKLTINRPHPTIVTVMYVLPAFNEPIPSLVYYALNAKAWLEPW